MNELFGVELVFRHWSVFALALVILEMLAPAAVFLWMGVAAGLVGFLLWAPPDLRAKAQFSWFAALSVLTVLGWRRYHESHSTETEQPLLNRRGQQLVGRTFTLE